MTNGILKIGIPHIEDGISGRVKLCADVEYAGNVKELYFEVDRQYENYLCTELSDAMIAGIFYFASYNGFDIVCQTPASERLLYQMNQYLIPTLNKMNPEHYKIIRVNAPASSLVFENRSGVGTAVSSGVDSFYSIFSHIGDDKYKDFALTHVLVANLFNKYDNEAATRSKFEKLVSQEKQIASNLGIPMITMYTNHHEFLFPDFVEYYSLRICSYVFALQKLFKTYLVSSGTMFQDSNFFSDDSTDYDVFNTPMMSTDNVTFYMSGGECGRVEKIEYIRNRPSVRKYLHVCTIDENKNCSICDKCMRTMVALELTGDIADYQNIFNLDEYRKRKVKYLGKAISRSRDNVYGVLNIELLQETKKRNKKVPVRSYVYAWFFWTPFFCMKELLKKSRIIRKMYFSLKLDYVLYGKEKAELYRFNKKTSQ